MEDVHAHIEELVAEEHRLWRLESEGSTSDADRARLDEIKVELDRYWDLLRQRRALHESGLDEDVARLRTGETVEGYLQ